MKERIKRFFEFYGEICGVFKVFTFEAFATIYLICDGITVWAGRMEGWRMVVSVVILWALWLIVYLRRILIELKLQNRIAVYGNRFMTIEEKVQIFGAKYEQKNLDK